jgi:hypothetical protein
VDAGFMGSTRGHVALFREDSWDNDWSLETYHQDGPRAFGPMTGTFGDAEIEWYGELNRNRSVLIYRDVHTP